MSAARPSPTPPASPVPGGASVPAGSPVPAGSVAPSGASAAAATAVFVRLKLSLLRNGLRQSSGRTAAFVTSVVFTLLLAAGQLIGLIALRGNDHATAVVVLLTALMALGWAALPLFFPSGDETLDPTRLVMLPLEPRRLVGSLLIASLVGIGPLFTLVLAVGSVIAVAHGAAAVAAGVIAAPLVLLVCVTFARAVAAGNIRLLTSRKGRDLAVLSGLFIALGTQFVNLGVQKLSSSEGLASLEPAAEVLRWVPPAAAVDAVRSAGAGAYGVALAQLALTAVAGALLLWWWQRSLTRLMTAPDGSTLQAASEPSGKAGRASAGLSALLPAGRVGTVAQRTLRYAWRDPKAKASWATSLGVGLLVPFVTAVQGNGSVYVACWAAGLLGMQMYNQFGQDTSAFWMVSLTISSTRDAYLELCGRALALAVVAVPYVTLTVLGTAAFLGQWDAFPEALGLALALLGALTATGAIGSALFPYSIPQDSGYKNVAPGQVSLAWTSILGGMVAGAALCLPLLGVTVWLHLADARNWLWVILPLGALYGWGLSLLGLRLAAPRTAARLPEILTAVSKG
ncbi:transporter [Streptomyces sp. URMC 123]|uniref:transporter n=1 Tax=Streptomyces sp. URMC 123 TaxID=3423403 RepID=UPI003F1BEBB1